MILRLKTSRRCIFLLGWLFFCPPASFAEGSKDPVQQLAKEDLARQTESLKQEQQALIENYHKEKMALKQSTQFQMETAADKKTRTALMREGKRKQEELERAFKNELRACKNEEKKLNPRKGQPEIQIIIGEGTGGGDEPEPWGGEEEKGKKTEDMPEEAAKKLPQVRSS